MNGHAPHSGQLGGASGQNDFGMASHALAMHYAQPAGKCLLHSRARYVRVMTTPYERLKIARERLFESAGEAADALGVPRGTYAGHENGNRGIPAKRAPMYARKFGVSEEWLLYGKGPKVSPHPSERDLEQMVRETIEAEMTVATKISDLPRIVASSLHEQLERFRADRERASSEASSNAPGKGAQSRETTKPAAGE